MPAHSLGHWRPYSFFIWFSPFQILRGFALFQASLDSWVWEAGCNNRISSRPLRFWWVGNSGVLHRLIRWLVEFRVRRLNIFLMQLDFNSSIQFLWGSPLIGAKFLFFQRKSLVVLIPFVDLSYGLELLTLINLEWWIRRWFVSQRMLEVMASEIYTFGTKVSRGKLPDIFTWWSPYRSDESMECITKAATGWFSMRLSRLVGLWRKFASSKILWGNGSFMMFTPLKMCILWLSTLI